TLAQRRAARQRDQARLEVARGPQVELLGGLVVLEDRATVGADEVVGARDNRVEDDIDVERGTDSLAHRAECPKLVHRARQLPGAGFEFFEETDIFNGDPGLVGEGLEQFALAVRERSRLPPDDRQQPKHRVAQYERQVDERAIPAGQSQSARDWTDPWILE